MTREFLKEILSEDKFKGEFVKCENGILTYKSKLKFYPNDESRIMCNKHISFEIPVDKIKNKILTNIIEDVEEFCEYAVL
jgi:hypothetical protein